MRRISGDVTLPDVPSAGVGDFERPAGLPARYRIHEVIGTGGMGKVYRAKDTTLGRDVAIKVIHLGTRGTDATKQRERFAREARAAARLAHPNIVGVHDVDPEAGWLVMDLIEGVSLSELREAGASSPALVRDVAVQVLGALDAAHAAGVIHRDVKPSNILVDHAGKATLVDFGVARLVDAEMTRTGETVGTPAYMAPEQLRGAAVDERTDLYGLGATLYEMATGDRLVAFESPGEAAIEKLADSLAGDSALVRLIERCLQGDPVRRPASARDALAELRATTKRRRWWPLAAAVVIAAVPAWLLLGHRDSDADRRFDNAFANAQRGEHQKAQLELADYLVSHPADQRALTLEVLVHWWQFGLWDIRAVAFEAELEPAQRALVRGIKLMVDRLEPQAIAYLETAQQEHPGAVEIEFGLGEARWHAGMYERGVETLEHAYALDPQWMMALHHVLEYRLSRGEGGKLAPIAEQLATVDPPRAAALGCQMAIAERNYTAAIGRARAGLLIGEPIPDLHLCLAQAYVLAGELARAEDTMKKMADRWPIDLREWGGFAMQSELLLYRGKYTEYLELLRGKPSRQRDLSEALWDPGFKDSAPETVPTLQPSSVLETFGMRGPPLGIAMVLLAEHTRGRDALRVYDDDFYLEIRAYGRGLAGHLRNDLELARTELRRALATPSKGDIRMLIAHELASVERERGDEAAVREACREIIAPAQYFPYRAVVLPDCVLWSGDRAQWRALSDNWQGDFEHPAVAEIRRQLGGG